MLTTHPKGLVFRWKTYFEGRLPGPQILAALILFHVVLGAEQPSAITYLVSPLQSVSGFTGDSRGNVYAVGAPNPGFVPTPGAPYPVITGYPVSALVKLDPTGEVAFATYVPGDASALTIDNDGNAFVFSQQAFPGGTSNSLLLKFNGSGTNAIEGQVLACAVCGNLITNMAVDSLGNVYMAGSTRTDVSTTIGALQSNRLEQDAFILKYDPKAGRVVYATYLGGAGYEFNVKLAVDGTGNAYVGGTTTSKDFPVTSGAYQTSITDGASSGFLVKINPEGTGLVFSTYLGSAISNITLDMRGGGVFAGVNYGGTVVVRLSPDGRQLVSSTNLDLPFSFAGMDPAGNIVAVGGTEFTSYRGINPLQLLGTPEFPFRISRCPLLISPLTFGPCLHAILAKLDPQGKVIWSSLLGRDNGVQAWISGTFVDSSGNIYAAVNGFAFIKVEPVGPPPLLATASVVNSAEFNTNIAAGGLVSVFGTGLTTAQGTINASVPLPMTLEGTSVSILGKPAPILAVATNGLGQEQVNVQAPLIVYGEGPGGSNGLNMIVVRRGRALGYADIFMRPLWPAIFALPGQPAVTHADSSFLTRDNPARPGETIVVWYTGGGAVTPPVAAGQPAPSSPLSTTLTTPLVSINGQNAAVSFSGLTPGYVGLYQINVIVPPAPAGQAALSLAIPNYYSGGVPLITSTVTIYIR